MEDTKERAEDQDTSKGVDARHQRFAVPVKDKVNQSVLSRSQVVPSDVEGYINCSVNLYEDDVPKLELIRN